MPFILRAFVAKVQCEVEAKWHSQPRAQARSLNRRPKLRSHCKGSLPRRGLRAEIPLSAFPTVDSSLTRARVPVFRSDMAPEQMLNRSDIRVSAGWTGLCGVRSRCYGFAMANKRGDVVEVPSPRLFNVALPAWGQVNRHRAIRYSSVTLQRLNIDAFRCLSVQTKVTCVIVPHSAGMRMGVRNGDNG
jgi:hypothetical protein